MDNNIKFNTVSKTHIKENYESFESFPFSLISSNINNFKDSNNIHVGRFVKNEDSFFVYSDGTKVKDHSYETKSEWFPITKESLNHINESILSRKDETKSIMSWDINQKYQDQYIIISEEYYNKIVEQKTFLIKELIPNIKVDLNKKHTLVKAINTKTGLFKALKTSENQYIASPIHLNYGKKTIHSKNWDIKSLFELISKSKQIQFYEINYNEENKYIESIKALDKNSPNIFVDFNGMPDYGSFTTFYATYVPDQDFINKFINVEQSSLQDLLFGQNKDDFLKSKNLTEDEFNSFNFSSEELVIIFAFDAIKLNKSYQELMVFKKAQDFYNKKSKPLRT